MGKMSSAVPRSMVLGNDGLLDDILLRVDSPTTLVRAALVSKRWYQGASFPAFLRRFRELNPPHLLGIYVSCDGIPYPEFVQVPTPQPPEHTAAARRANFGFAEFSSTVWDCRNGHILYEFDQPFHLDRAPAMRTPLRYPGQDLAVFPLPPVDLPQLPLAMLLPDNIGDNATCYRVDIGVWDRVFYAKVSVLRSGKWSIHCSAAERLVKSPEKILTTNATLLADGKIYMMATAGFILGLDMSTATFFIIELPEGVTFEYDGGLVLCRGDNSALYLFQVKGDKLSVWLCRADDHAGAGTGEWVLKDTISVKETCADFVDKGPGQADGVVPAEVGPEPPADGGDDALIEVVHEPPADGDDDVLIEVGPEVPADDDGEAPNNVVGVGENAEFVFLELGDSGVVVYLHLGSKKVEKVYQRDPDNDNVVTIHPFLMVWPPVFPALHEAEAEEAHQE